nr:MAG TPA: hypothetical protein [Caudoviricetes sp.]
MGLYTDPNYFAKQSYFQRRRMRRFIHSIFSLFRLK